MERQVIDAGRAGGRIAAVQQRHDGRAVQIGGAGECLLQADHLPTDRQFEADEAERASHRQLERGAGAGMEVVGPAVAGGHAAGQVAAIARRVAGGVAVVAGLLHRRRPVGADADRDVPAGGACVFSHGMGDAKAKHREGGEQCGDAGRHGSGQVH